MNTFGSSPFANIPPVVKNLLIINVIFFIASSLFPMLSNYLAVYYFDSPRFRVWQIVTYMFMHGGIGHIFFNMFALFTFGTSLEYIMGPKRFLNFYLLTGLGALALQFAVQGMEVYNILGSIVNNDLFRIDNAGSVSYDSRIITLPSKEQSTLAGIYLGGMVGASGAIFGLLIAFGLLFPNAELFIIFFPVPIKAKYLIPVYIVFELFMGVYKVPGDSIAHFAHLGGALFGFILIKMWGLRRPGGYI